MVKQLTEKPEMPKLVEVGNLYGVKFVTIKQPKWFQKILDSTLSPEQEGGK
jgi:hypothetical protein